MLITFTGPQSSGKTTLINQCKSHYGNRFKYIGEIARNVQKRGLPINEDGNDISQLLIINSYLDKCLETNAIIDRCIIDPWMYTQYSCEKRIVSPWVLEYCQRVFHLTIHRYDIIFYTDPEVPLIKDGTRSENQEFRNAIIKNFNKFLDVYEKSLNIIRLCGSVEDRFNIVQNTIKKASE